MYKVTILGKHGSQSTLFYFSKKNARDFMDSCQKRGVKAVQGWKD